MVEHVANIRRGEGGWKTIIRAEIILRSSARNGGKFDIAIDIELYLAFAGPSTRELRPRQKSSNVPALALHPVKNCVGGVGAFHAGAPPLGVEVACFARNSAGSSFIVDLKGQQRQILVAVIGEGDAGMLVKGHRPIAVHR